MNGKDIDGRTAILWAASNGNYEWHLLMLSRQFPLIAKALLMKNSLVQISLAGYIFVLKLFSLLSEIIALVRHDIVIIFATYPTIYFFRYTSLDIQVCFCCFCNKML